MIDNVVALPDPGLGNSSYVVDVGGGTALVVDPSRDASVSVATARRLGLTIALSVETHLHADFVSGSRELAARGAEVLAAPAAGLRFASRAAEPGRPVRIGDATITVLPTPGHTPEHVAYLIELDGSSAVFSGGSLIVGGAARTDLVDPAQTRALARAQFRSLRRLAELPDETLLFPTHGAGSFCSAGPASGTHSTIGEQRRDNPLLQIDDEASFVDHLLSTAGTFPPYFLHLREVNRLPALTAQLPAPEPLSPRAADALRRDGAWLIDTRAVGAWASGHAMGSVSIALRDQFASWLGWVVPFGEPFVVITADEKDANEVARQARHIGFDRFLGFVEGGFEAWIAEGLPAVAVREVDPLQARALAGRGAVLLDVRQTSEVATSRIPGSLHLELGDIIAGRSPDAPEIVTYCGHGERSATAASLLEARGHLVANLVGGIGAWTQAGFPVAA